MVRAFDADPYLTYSFPNADRRKGALAMIAKAVIRDAARHGHVDLASERSEVAAALIWYPPGGYPMSIGRLLRLVPTYVRLALVRPRGMLNVLRLQMKLDQVHPKEPHYYFFFAATDPTRGGAGLLGLVAGLSERVFEEADAMDAPCYLETQNRRNLRLFRRKGFEVVHDRLETVAGGPPSWTMWRPQRSKRSDGPAVSATTPARRDELSLKPQ